MTPFLSCDKIEYVGSSSAIPKNKKEEFKCIEEYIKMHRKKIEADKKINKRIKIAIYLSYINFNMVRLVFDLKGLIINR